MKKILILLLLINFTSNAQFVELKNDRIKLNPNIYLTTTGSNLPNLSIRSTLGSVFNGLSFDNENGKVYFRIIGTPNATRFEITDKLSLEVFDNVTGIISNRLSILNNGKVGISTGNPQTDFEVNGFSKLGSDAPAIKVKKLTGTSSAFQGGAVSVAHGLTASKILNISVILDFGTNTFIPSSYNFNPGYEFDWYSDATNIIVTNKSNNSGSVLSKPFKILITYEE